MSGLHTDADAFLVQSYRVGQSIVSRGVEWKRTDQVSLPHPSVLAPFSIASEEPCSRRVVVCAEMLYGSLRVNQSLASIRRGLRMWQLVLWTGVAIDEHLLMHDCCKRTETKYTTLYKFRP